MCDYSLEAYRTRPAREGERYVTTRFGSGSMGLASPGDASIPVCVPCDTALRLEGIPAELRDRHGLRAVEDATFVHLEQGAWRDGVRFRNGATVSLQMLPTGLDVTVTGLLEKAARRFEGAAAI
ncbi:MAG: hypothetical protein KGL11_00535 [Alphaproteobacteria bacterium]|nr:hypothetical protein [Alphaproteobacteria bacterium]